MVILVISILYLVAAGLALLLIKQDRGPKEPPKLLWSMLRFGVAAVLVAMFFNEALLPVELGQLIGSSDPEAETQTPSLLFVFVAAMMIGIIEETAKIAPLSFSIFKNRYFNEHTDGIIYFALVGLVFGFIEDVFYVMAYGPETGLLRLITAPYFHAATAAIFGFYLARYKITGKSKRAVILAFIAAIVFHGLYNFGLFSSRELLVVFSLMITAALNVGFFIYYQEAKRLDEAHGLRAHTPNRYCRRCGEHNSNHSLYCERCGFKA